MDETRREPGSTRRRCYRIELEGVLDASWSDWFDAVVLPTADGRTILETAPMDQAELHGVLRRLHDMHLQLVAVADVAHTSADGTVARGGGRG